MASAKDIHVAPISSQDSNALVRRVHYSGKVVNNSQLHLGVFLNGRLEGAMQFGPSMDKRKILGLVEGTPWNGMIELNRMAFSDALPRNSESRALGIAMRLIRKHYPHIQWVISFADGTQCGDGTIYRASGFLLTGIKENSTIIRLADGTTAARITFEKGSHIIKNGGAARAPITATTPSGFQLRYIYFMSKEAREKLTVPIIPFSQIEKIGASMYKGKAIKRASSKDSVASCDQQEEGGVSPTDALQSKEGNK